LIQPELCDTVYIVNVLFAWCWRVQEMIVDRIDNARLYAGVHPLFAKAFEFLARGDFAGLSSGRNKVGEFIAIPVEADGKGRQGARLERHQKEIDIHFTVTGVDVIGWKPTALLEDAEGEFDVEGDVQFFNDLVRVWTEVQEGQFAVFLPSDGHAPLAGDGPVSKTILKIPV
jgi:YhcH/YjgK/YiaL family protein